MSLSFENLSISNSASFSSVPVNSNDSQTPKPSQEVARSMESGESVYKRY